MVQDQGRRPTADEGRADDQIRPREFTNGKGQKPAQNNRGHGSKARARTDPDQTGVGQRVAKQTLQHRARHGQGRANQGAGRHARHADVPHDGHVARADLTHAKTGQQRADYIGIARRTPSKRQQHRHNQHPDQAHADGAGLVPAIAG